MDASEGSDTLPGVEVIDFYAERHLYTALGRRRITPPLRFGLAVLLHCAIGVLRAHGVAISMDGRGKRLRTHPG